MRSVTANGLRDVQWELKEKGGDKVGTHFRTAERQKRMVKIISAAVFEGMRAAKALLKGTEQIFFGPSGRIYKKSGGYDKAEKDFDLVKPRNVEPDDSIGEGKRGEVGDREIILKREGWLGNPTVYLIRNYKGPFRAGEIDAVMYTD